MIIIIVLLGRWQVGRLVGGCDGWMRVWIHEFRDLKVMVGVLLNLEVR